MLGGFPRHLGPPGAETPGLGRFWAMLGGFPRELQWTLKKQPILEVGSPDLAVKDELSGMAGTTESWDLTLWGVDQVSAPGSIIYFSQKIGKCKILTENKWAFQNMANRPKRAGSGQIQALEPEITARGAQIRRTWPNTDPATLKHRFRSSDTPNLAKHRPRSPKTPVGEPEHDKLGHIQAPESVRDPGSPETPSGEPKHARLGALRLVRMETEISRVWRSQGRMCTYGRIGQNPLAETFYEGPIPRRERL